MTITSQHNQKLKEIRKLRGRRRHREQAGRFIAEGEDLLQAADAAGWAPVERYCAAGSGLPGIEVEPELLADASGLGSGTRALGVYEERWAARALGPLCVYLHGVRDPGNVGTVLRSAQAFGATSVALGPRSADPFGPKAVRASMGAVFTVPLARETDATRLPGTRVALATGRGDPLVALCPLFELVARDEVTLLVGAEREGLPEDVVAQADYVAHIPIVSESLNAAMAATIALYEVTRMPRA
jgi:TrmH family RNA methyltransferase